MRRLRRILPWVGSGLVVALLLVSASQILAVALFDSDYDGGTADCAIVLGAAVWNGKPSPVYRERIRFGVDLARRGKVRALLFTGGVGAGDTHSEGRVGHDEAVKAGVPAARVFFEERSHSTFQNLTFARPILAREKLADCYLVSDGPHLKRATVMAKDLRMIARPAATPTTRFTSTYARVRFVVVEAYYLFKYRVRAR